jgi:hypothetical protein
MKARRGRCFSCGARLNIAEIRPRGPFACPNCQILLRPTQYYGLGYFLVILLCSVSVFWAVGVRGVDLLYDALLIIVPIVFFTANFLKYLIPPKTELYGPESKDSSLRLRD